MTKATHLSRIFLAAFVILLTSQLFAETKADSVKPGRLSVIPVPVIAYTPETKWVGGLYVGIIYHFDDSLRPSSTSIKALYSQLKQMVFGIDPTVYVGRYQLGNTTEILKWPDFFYGIGNNVPASAEEQYTARVISTEFVMRREMVRHFYAGVRYKFDDVKLTETEPGGLLASRSLPAPVDGVTSGAGAVTSYDTRDHIFFPTSGMLYSASASFYGTGLGSDFTYNDYGFDLRNYLPITGTHLIALQANGSFMSGNPQFRDYAVIGGDNKLRGYNGARFRDRQSFYAQVEYRFPIWWRFRGAVFTGAGDVANEIADFAPRKFKHVVGGGLRFLVIPKEKISLRMDVGYGINSDGFYLAVNEAF